MEWEVVIGLETHTQLKTNTKIFSGASTTYGAEPNTQACEVSIALPGVLPVLNKQAVECAITFGLAIDAEIAPRSVFARKNYFYPDLPKGYQISQYELPVVGKGRLWIDGRDEPIRITRAHLEEDAGKSVHGLDKYVEDGYAESGYFEERQDLANLTGIDLNRAGTPLLEIVTEPDMRSAAEAVAYAKKLHELVQWIGICDGNMQEGSFRCDVNVSVRPKGQKEYGTRREIKNLNSFKFMQQAIEYETQWQIDTLENGGKIQQATVLFNPDTGETRAMRSKEEANDYRYFPDPDLLPLEVTEADVARVRASMPELPEHMAQRFISDYTATPEQAFIATSSINFARFFERSVLAAANIDDELLDKVIRNLLDEGERELVANYVAVDVAKSQIRIVMNWLSGELLARLKRHELNIADCPITPKQLATLSFKISSGEISNSAAKQVFEAMWAGETDIDAIIAAKGLKQESDAGAIEAIIDEVLAANPAMVDEFKAGKEKAFNALVGQAMKASKGKANPAQVNEILKKKLS
jgi:aspartyl-tRNA(Asn)/glutamyl-tRNA(Gln) amidotransferase subunit B